MPTSAVCHLEQGPAGGRRAANESVSSWIRLIDPSANIRQICHLAGLRSGAPRPPSLVLHITAVTGQMRQERTCDAWADCDRRDLQRARWPLSWAARAGDTSAGGHGMYKTRAASERVLSHFLLALILLSVLSYTRIGELQGSERRPRLITTLTTLTRRVPF